MATGPPGHLSFHSPKLQGPGVAKRELPSLSLQRASTHQVATGGHPTFSILGGRRTSELIAEQNMDKGKGRKEPAAGLGTVLQKEFREVFTHKTNKT